MQRPRKKQSRARAPESPALGSLLLIQRTRQTLAKEILRRSRQQVAPLELWLLDRMALVLERPKLGGLQQPARISLAPGEAVENWPDLIRLPGPSPSVVFLEIATTLTTPALVQLLRVPEGPREEVYGLMLAPSQSRGEPDFLERTMRALAAQAAIAFANFQALQALRDHASRLSKLYETAHQLSSELDLDRVLATICARARALTGSDIAYITLMNPGRGVISMKATDGVRTQAFKKVRLKLGQGLGGLVAKEGRPYFSSDYLHDGRFIHVVDDAVAAERIVSVMGVPLKVADQMIGVLFAANRHKTTFSEEAIGFLEMLAEHAAIAMENARLHKQAQDTLKRERQLHRLAERQRRDLEELSQLHDRLTYLVLAERTMGELLEEISSAIGCQIFMRDAADCEVAVPIAAGTTNLGWLCAEAIEESSPSQPQVVLALEQAARVVALHLLRERAVVQAEYRIRGEFLQELLQADPRHYDEIIRRGSYLGIDLSRPLSVLFVVSHNPDIDKLALAVSRASQEFGGELVASRSGGVVVIVASEDPARLAASLHRLLQREIPAATVGFAIEPSDLTSLPDSLREAQSVARTAVSLGRREAISRKSLGFYAALLDGNTQLISFAETLLRPVADYDLQHGTNLLQTLEAYLDAEGHVTETARGLVLHVNTLYYRLRRVREVGGYDLDDPETRFELQLALRIRKTTSVYGRESQESP